MKINFFIKKSCRIFTLYPAATQQLLHHRPPKFIVMQSNDTTYKVSKAFILDAHKAACSEWKAKIEAECPDLFPKPVTFKCGDQINFIARGYEERGYLIARVAAGLVNIIKIDEGNRWGNPIAVKSATCITMDEMRQLLGYIDMDSIEKI